MYKVLGYSIRVEYLYSIFENKYLCQISNYMASNKFKEPEYLAKVGEETDRLNIDSNTSEDKTEKLQDHWL